MTAHRAVLALGSNIPDRMVHLQGAVDGLISRGMRIMAVSAVYETEPVGGPTQDDFLNAVVIVETDLSPRELLAACHEVEALHDRRRDVRWGPRTLDVDVIDVDGYVSDDPVLTLPHPRARERAFVCLPWLDADGDAQLPEGSVQQIAGQLDRRGVVRREDLELTIVPGTGT